jgi:asparagine synthase (glutamine-hydrolysing)
MCGVAGFFAYGANAAVVDRDELRAVRDHMATRGPDGSGEWFSTDGRVALGHRRLAIIDLSERGAQPMASADGQLVISFNGEIYNHRELRQQLERTGRVFHSNSDTEVLLHLYEQHGTAMLTMLRGMFAFALWDARARAMLLARDPLGIKPIYYAKSDGTFRAASQVKALLRADVDRSPDPAGHAGFYLWGSVPAPWTLYRGIRALPAGHFAWVRETGMLPPQPYCVVSDMLGQAAARPAKGSANDALDHIAQALRSSVAAHLVADVPVGVFLSGGLDSALLVALATEQGMTPRTLTLGFEEYRDTPQDEAPVAREIAALLGTRHTTQRVHRSDFIAERAKLLAAMDQPSIDGVNTWFVARAAASQGIKVALSGLGGDELFGSYPSFRQIPQLTRVAAPLTRFPRFGLNVRRLAEPLVRHVASPKYAGLLEYGGTAGGAYLLRRGLFMPWELPQVMDPDMARTGWSELETIARLDDTAGRVGARSSRLSISALEMSWYMRHQLLADADWAGMAHSLEIRVPLADVELLRAAAPWFATHPQISKREVVRHAAPHLPQQLLDRPKTGFTVPVREWLGADATSTRGLRAWSRYVHTASSGTQDGSAARRRVLVSTIAAGTGGVSAMTAFAVRALAARGLEPVIAHYATYSTTPQLSVPSFKLLQRRPGHVMGRTQDGSEIHAFGAWLPELEFTHYLPTHDWRELIESCAAYVVVSGNVLPATPFAACDKPYLGWIATDWDGDRRDRVKHFPLVRRLLDTCLNGPVTRRLERKLLRGGHIVSLSDYTRRMLQDRAGTQLSDTILPMPIDVASFSPRPGSRVAGRLGFAGRFNDPRKNIGLLLRSLARLRELGHDVHAVLMGDAPDARVTRLVAGLGLAPHVSFRPGLSQQEMRDCLQTLDVFVLPSHQEGLCISALEAMACGVPVVSTRCGGPEEFVIPGWTGELVGADAMQMADALAELLTQPAVRERLASGARQIVRDHYSLPRAEAIFIRALETTFPGLPNGDSVALPAHALVHA